MFRLNEAVMLSVILAQELTESCSRQHEPAVAFGLCKWAFHIRGPDILPRCAALRPRGKK